MTTKAEIIAGLKGLGLKGGIAAFHSSLSSLGRVEGGAGTVISALKETLATFMMPTFYYRGACLPPKEEPAWINNADDDSWKQWLPVHAQPFDPKSSPVVKDMGVIPQALVEDPQSLRGGHPMVGWTAWGEAAKDLVQPDDWMDPYFSLRQLIRLNGKVVLLGTSLTSCTALHLAEEKAGREPFVRWVMTQEGLAARVRVGGCSDGFDGLWPELSPIFQAEKIGQAEVFLADAAQLVNMAAQAIARQPTLTRCKNPACARCDAALKGGPSLPAN